MFISCLLSVSKLSCGEGLIFLQTGRLQVCLRVTSPSKFNIMPIVTGTLMGRVEVQHIQPVTCRHNVNFDGDRHRYEYGNVTCNQAFPELVY